ncbi:MAG: hypothetical protein RLY14_2538 [Planctomycetota bacterium]|jgi:hypothetical protein
MWNMLSQPVVQAGLSFLLLMLVTAIGFRIVSSLRDWSKKKDTSLPETLGKFEEMRREGDISEAEFRTIEAMLGRIGAKRATEVENKSATSGQTP